MKWRKFGLLILAAIIGSGFTTATFLMIGNEKRTIQVEHLSSTPVVGAAYTVNAEGEVVPLEFTGVAKKVTPAVVHIKSTMVSRGQEYGYERSPGPFGDQFDNDFFRRFFGPEFRFEQPAPRAPQPRIGSGSGVIINPDGYVVTNNHVIQGADDIEVVLNDNQTFKAKVVGTDPSTDLALLQIRASDLPYLPLLNSDEVEVGEWVLAVGNPFNLNSTVTAGIISAKARNINILRDRSAIESFIQTDAAINPGNSGGALVNLQGGLVGINTAIASATGYYSGYGFAIPSNIVSKVVEDLIEYGMVQRGYLGLLIRSVDGDLAREMDLEVTEGVYVDSITANSAAGEAGILEGDVIVAVNDAETRSSSQLLEIIGRQRPGDEVTLDVNRSGKALEFEVVLRNQEGKTTLFSKEAEGVLDILGVKLEEVDDDTARKLGIESGLKIRELGSGKLKRYTDVRQGFIITKVDGKPVSSLESFVSHLERTKGGVMLEGVYEDVPGAYYYAFGLD
jgi:Do/DeqQ family serine protease